MSFEFMRLKQKFLFDTYKLLIENNWTHYIFVYEDTEDTDDGYYTIATIVFQDEKDYFRCLEIPLPILQDESKGEFKEMAEHMLNQINSNADNVKRLPRSIWRNVPVRDVYEMIKK